MVLSGLPAIWYDAFICPINQIQIISQIKKKHSLSLNHQPITSTLKQEMHSSLLVPCRGKMDQNDCHDYINRGLQGIYVAYDICTISPMVGPCDMHHQPWPLDRLDEWLHVNFSTLPAQSPQRRWMDHWFSVVELHMGLRLFLGNVFQLNSNWGSCWDSPY